MDLNPEDELNDLIKAEDMRDAKAKLEEMKNFDDDDEIADDMDRFSNALKGKPFSAKPKSAKKQKETKNAVVVAPKQDQNSKGGPKSQVIMDPTLGKAGNKAPVSYTALTDKSYVVAKETEAVVSAAPGQLEYIDQKLKEQIAKHNELLSAIEREKNSYFFFL